MRRLICLSCLLLVGCGEKSAPKPTTTPEPASLPAAQPTAQPKETATAQSRIDKVTKTLIGTWEGQSDQVRLMMEFGADRTIIESADPGGGWKSINKGTWRVVEAEGDAVTLEINPKGKSSYRQTDVFDGSDKFHHKHGDKVIPFVRK